MIVKSMLNVQLMMFLLVIVGYIVRRSGIVGAEGRKNIVDLCLYVTLPFNIVNAFIGKFEWNILVTSGIVILLSIGYNIISILISGFLFKKEEDKKQKPLRYGTIVSNGSFLGNPVIEGVYGTTGLFYAAVFSSSYTAQGNGLDGVTYELLFDMGLFTAEFWSPKQGTNCHKLEEILERVCMAVKNNDPAAIDALEPDVVELTKIFKELFPKDVENHWAPFSL